MVLCACSFAEGISMRRSSSLRIVRWVQSLFLLQRSLVICAVPSQNLVQPGNAGLLTIDRIRDSPTPTRTETSREPPINALNLRTRAFARSTRRHSTASSTNHAYSRSAIGASNCHPRPASASHIWNYVFAVPGCAAHVLKE